MRMYNRRFYRLALGAAVTLACMSGQAASLNVPAFTQITIYPGQYYDSATVQSDGTLIMSGGAIGTNTSPSVTVLQGGRFYMNDGLINYFDNRGIAEFYGGAQSTFASENRGYVKIAGYDPGIQLIHYTGTVDIFYLATNRLSWEIYSVVTNGSPVIRFFSLTNTLAAGTYTTASLPKVSFPFGFVHTNHSLFWGPQTNKSVRTEILIASNWPGRVIVQTYEPLTTNISCFIEPASPVLLGWNSISGRVYQLEDAFSLPLQDWLASGVPVTATAPTTTINSAGINSTIYYRVKLRH